MALYRNRRFLIGALMASLMFGSLLVYRVQFYNGTFSTTVDKESLRHKELKAGDTWMNIIQNFKKIGYTHRSLENISTGYKIHEETVMKINTMGITQKIHVQSNSTTDIDFAVQTFNFEIASGSFNFSLTGEIKGNILYIESSDKIEQHEKTADTQKEKRRKPMEIPLENRPHLTSGIMQATVAAGLKPDQEMVLFVFDPSTLGQAPATIKMEGSEEIGVNGKKITAQKVSLFFKGAKQFAWLDENGEVVKEKGLLGITLIKTDRNGAVDGTSLEASDDLTSLVSVKSNKLIDKPESLTQLTIRVSNLDNMNIDLNMGRQTLKEHHKGSSNGVLTIEKESLKGLPQKLDPKMIDSIDSRFRTSDAFVQSNDHRIRSFAFKAISESDTSLEKVKKLVGWIQQNIQRHPVISLPNALSTLENRMGDCNEHAALLAAFCRAIGIPAKIEAGMVYLNGSFYYHAWNSVFIGRWITVDALFNQIPADVPYISFSSGINEMQLDIAGVIGRVQIEVLE